MNNAKEELPLETEEISSEGFDWSEIERKFDKIIDVDEMFYFLRELVNRLQICSDKDCKIFPELHGLNLQRMQFKEYKTLQDVKEKEKDSTKRSKFERDYWDFIAACKQTFDKVFALKSIEDTIEKNVNAWHKRKIQMMETANKNKTATQREYEDEIQQGIKQTQDIENALMSKVKLKMMDQAK